MFPATPPRKAEMRVNPAGTLVPSASLATILLVSKPETASSRSPAVSNNSLCEGVSIGSAILRCTTPVRHAVRSAVHGLCIGRLRSCCTASAYRDMTTENAVSSPVGRECSFMSLTFAIDASPPTSTTMVLVAGQYDAGGLDFASGQFAALKDNVGGCLGEKTFAMTSISVDKLSLSIVVSPVSGFPLVSVRNLVGKSPRRF